MFLCGSKIPHSTWHQNAFIHLMYIFLRKTVLNNVFLQTSRLYFLETFKK